ncbi:hypothetical protein H2199_002635 [Coniosporium tulheliwenetii]|uniref:Uncharacterized protein n=1 Tax=Coniosporium tulheliwenetii TaxID=3383036 RepID=A0ACC2ZH05_9PEZI|nr:hypothetical protein H2199_002635 [Cladosporium sp. JES 115]
MFAWRGVKDIKFVQFRLTLDLRSEEDMALMDERWCPPDDWSGPKYWDPWPEAKPPTIPSDWLLHLWEHPHDSWSFKLSMKTKLGILRAVHLLVGFSRTTAPGCRKAAKELWSDMAYFRGWGEKILPLFEDIELQQSAADNTPSGSITAASTTGTVPQCAASLGSSLERRQNMIYRCTPKKLFEKLKADPSSPPYGWGLYLEEGFMVPEPIQWMASFFAICAIFGILALCIAKLGELGVGVFEAWSGTIALAALIFTVVTKLAGK